MTTCIAEFNAHVGLNRNATVNAIKSALASMISDQDLYGLRFDRDLETAEVVLVTVTIDDTITDQTALVVKKRISQLPGVSSVIGDGILLINENNAGQRVGPPSEEEIMTQGRILNLENQLSLVTDQINIFANRIQFIGEPFNPSATALTVDIPLQVTDADGRLIQLSDVSEVQVDITDGSAANAQIKHLGQTSPVDGSLIVPLVDGAALIQVVATGTGFVDLGLTDTGSSGLAVSDTARVIFS